MNILEILKTKPLGTPLWSPAFGNVFLDKVDEDDQYPITIKYYNRTLNEWERDGLSCEGKFDDFDGAECILFPSKQMRNWEKFASFCGAEEEITPKFKDGDIVVVEDDYEKSIDIFKSFGGNGNKIRVYLSFTPKANQFTFGPITYKLGLSTVRAAKGKEEKQLLSKLSKIGKNWNPDTKKVEDLPKPCQFHPFDKVLVRDTPTDNWMPAFFSYVMNGRTDITYMTLSGEDYYECIPYAGNEHLLGTADSPSNGKEAIL